MVIADEYEKMLLRQVFFRGFFFRPQRYSLRAQSNRRVEVKDS
jgi:hypothetical protein